MAPAIHQTLLLVDDDDDDVVFMKMAFRKAGLLAFRVAGDGEAAINYLSGQGEYADRVRHPLPVLVFLDLKLPRVLGLDVLKWIRSQRDLDTMVVIILTSSPLHADVRAACALGANSFLVKPSNPLLLHELIDLVKRYWLNHNLPSASYSSASAVGRVR